MTGPAETAGTAEGETEAMAGKIEIDVELCKGCGFCVEVCPVKIIRMSGKINKHSSHYAEVTVMDKCTGCRLCGLVCPDVAITVWKDKK